MSIKRMTALDKIVVEISVLILIGFCIFGCGKKENQMPAVKVSSPQAEALPELEQNKIFLTNRPANIEPPDYSYHETQDGLEPSPAGMENLGPPAD